MTTLMMMMATTGIAIGARARACDARRARDAREARRAARWHRPMVDVLFRVCASRVSRSTIGARPMTTMRDPLAVACDDGW